MLNTTKLTTNAFAADLLTIGLSSSANCLNKLYTKKNQIQNHDKKYASYLRF